MNCYIGFQDAAVRARQKELCKGSGRTVLENLLVRNRFPVIVALEEPAVCQVATFLETRQPWASRLSHQTKRRPLAFSSYQAMAWPFGVLRPLFSWSSSITELLPGPGRQISLQRKSRTLEAEGAAPKINRKTPIG